MQTPTPRVWRIHLLLNLMVGELKVGNPVHCAALVGKLAQGQKPPVTAYQRQVRREPEAQA